MEPGVDYDCPFTFVTLSDQGYAVEVFCGRRKEVDKLLDKKVVPGVQAVYLYGPAGFVNSITA